MLKRSGKRVLGLLLALVMAVSLAGGACAADSAGALEETAEFVRTTITAPQVGSIGGEWAVLGLARSGCAVPTEYYDGYYARVEQYVKEKGGVLHARKYTEYSRLITALAALGQDARNVAGYDLTLPLGDYEKTVWQGINGAVWALIALDSRNYPMPQNTGAKTQATRQMYVDAILAAQLSDGGWSLTGNGASDADLTAMALQALAKYQDQTAAAGAVERGLACLSAMQQADGSYAAQGAATAESCAQVVVALCELGVKLDDPRFMKNGKSALDGLMGFYQQGGGFRHLKDGGTDQMATEQGLYALAAARRAETGKNSLYRMGDAVSLLTPKDQTSAGRDPAVQPVPVTAAGTTFADISGHAAQGAVEALAARGIITGREDGSFDPENSMTRSEFAAIVVRALGLTAQGTDRFDDVPGDSWFAGYVGAACAHGIVNGTGARSFTPQGTITRQEAAVMTARAAKLCGMDTDLTAAGTETVLAGLADGGKTDAWARTGVAFCYQTGILNKADGAVRPTDAVKRYEVAQMLYALLDKAELLTE